MRILSRMPILLCALAASTGCRVVEPNAKGHSPLVPLGGSTEAATLEIFSAPVAVADPRLDALWDELDEQQFDPLLRRILHANGIRAGVVGPHVPDPLAEMLKITDQRIAERSLVALDAEPGVVLRVLQPQFGHRNELIVNETRETVPMLWPVDGQIEGKTYTKAECQLALKVHSEPDSVIRLELVPEVHHGEMKARATGSDGVFVWKPERARQVFYDLKLAARLRPGQMLVMTCTTDKASSVGHGFFGLTGCEKPMQKVWVIRAAGAGPDRAFADGLKKETPAISSELTE